MTVIQYLHLQINFALDFIEIYFALLQSVTILFDLLYLLW